MRAPRSKPVFSFVSLVILALLAQPAGADFVNFESPPVHPLELSADGARLFAVHTADHRLVVYDLTQGQAPVRTAEIQVGIEPVTARVRNGDELWVVNHISDSISIIDLTTESVVRTLVVGDEPTDVVFAGSPEKAFVCVSQEDLLRVYDPGDLGVPPVDIPLSMSDPRSLAVSADGNSVFVCALDSQNRTTVVPFAAVEQGGGPPPPSPPMDENLPDPPRVGLIVRHNGLHWVDEADNSWDPFVGYTLLDHDVARVSASDLAVVETFSGVGTSLFNVAARADGRIYVSNQEAFNEIRFEPNLKGRFAQQRVTYIDPGGSVTPKHLNGHIDYGNEAGGDAERSLSLSTPLDLLVSDDGAVYVAAFGSGKVGVLDAEAKVTRRIDVGNGPAGLALDEGAGRLYVLNRISGTVSAVDLSDDSSVEVSLGFDATPASVAAGRARFYDGQASSAHGDLACATCHVFGRMDNISWDLGDPEGEFVPNGLGGFHPMKGPMATQSLLGLSDTDPFHWRGDRLVLSEFNPAFVSLMGRAGELSPDEFDELEDFVFSLTYPGNPLRKLDGSLRVPASGSDPESGEQLFLSGNLAGGVDCVDCHALPTGENGLLIPSQLLGEDQDMVVPQLRNLYEKTRFDNTTQTAVRGFGYTHDGAVDDLFSFLQFPGFTFDSDEDREDVAAFLLAFGTGTHTAVGAQWTMDGTNEDDGLFRVDTLMSVADLALAGLIAKGIDGNGETRGWMYQNGAWVPDRESEAPVSLQDLLDIAGPGTEITFTAVFPGCEMRLGLDRDGDGYFDRDELDAGTDPGDPESFPGAAGLADGAHASSRPRLDPLAPNPASWNSRLAFQLPSAGPVRVTVHDVRGRLVRTLLNADHHAAGVFNQVWDLRTHDGRPAAGGIYFVRLTSPSGSASRRIVIRR